MIHPLELMLWMDSEVHTSGLRPEELTATLGLCGVPLLQKVQAAPLLADCSRVWTTGHYRHLRQCSPNSRANTSPGDLFKIQILTQQT